MSRLIIEYVLRSLDNNLRPFQCRLYPQTSATIRLGRDAATAQQHLGWIHLFCGRISSIWKSVQQQYDITHPPTSSAAKRTIEKWEQDFVGLLIQYGLSLWEARNKHIHGSNKEEARKLRRNKAILQAKRAYQKGQYRVEPQLQPLYRIPLPLRIKQSTRQIERWTRHVELMMQTCAADQKRTQPRITTSFKRKHKTRNRLRAALPCRKRTMIQTDLRELLFHRRHTRFRFSNDP